MKNRKLSYLKVTIALWILAGLLIYLLYGCASAPFHKVITLDKVTIHIVSDRSQFDCPYARMNKNVNGYAKRNGEIWLLGHTRHGITVDKQRTLGHELLHLLNWQDNEIGNPDDR